MRLNEKQAFTLVELLVVIAIIGVLVGLILPAIQGAREVSRRASCQNNIRQLVVAINNYEFANESYPMGISNESGPIRNTREGNHMSWITYILPQLEERNRYKQLDFSAGAYHKDNEPIAQSIFPLLQCPTDYLETPATSYAGVHNHVESPIDIDNHGVLFLNSRITLDDLLDGSAYTIVLGEKTTHSENDLGWLSGTRATLRNTGAKLNSQRIPPALANANDEVKEFTFSGPINQDNPLAVGGFGSQHVGTVIFAFASGAVETIDELISAEVLQQLAHRSDGAVVGEW